MRGRLLLLLAALLAPALPAPARAQSPSGVVEPVSPDCNATESPVSSLASAVHAAAANCSETVANVDLATVKNLAKEFGCKDGSPCTVKAIIDAMAKQAGIPSEMLFAVAWTESGWTQWRRNGKPLISGTRDVGLFQISPAWRRQYDMQQVGADVLYNARAGAQILKWAYGYAKKSGLKGEDLERAAYAIYNGGPAAVHRPWHPESPWAGHDRNFARNIERKPWESVTRDCP